MFFLKGKVKKYSIWKIRGTISGEKLSDFGAEWRYYCMLIQRQFDHTVDYSVLVPNCNDNKRFNYELHKTLENYCYRM